MQKTKVKKLGSEELRLKIDASIRQSAYSFNTHELLGYRGEGVPNSAFIMNVSGEEPYKLQEALQDIGFRHFAVQAPYYWHCRHQEEQVVLEYVEGDVYLYDLKEYDKYKSQAWEKD